MAFEEKALNIYSSRDKIRQQLIQYASEYLDIENLDLTNTSYLSFLINSLSVMEADLLYYNTANYKEFFITKAKQKDSVINLAAMLGYTAPAATPSTVMVYIGMPSKFKSSTTLTLTGRNNRDKKPFQFYADDLVFSCENETIIDVVINNGAFVTATGISKNNLTGEIKNLTIDTTSSSTEFYFYVQATQIEESSNQFIIPSLVAYQFYTKNININSQFAGIQLFTQEATGYTDKWNDDLNANNRDHLDWTSFSSLYLMDSTDHGFVYNIKDDSINLTFGNDIMGVQPKAGDECTVIFSLTQGSLGNVNTGSINKTDTIYAKVKNNAGDDISLPVNMKCTNLSPATDGADYPGINEIRKNAIAQVSTNSRLVSNYDFQYASTIVKDLPINNCNSVLKRSDLKQNEITLYTDIIFDGDYVPTRNEVITFTKYYGGTPRIFFGDSVNTTIDSTGEYVSLFNFEVTNINNSYLGTYYYILDEHVAEVVITHGYLSNTMMVQPTYTNFNVITDPQSSANDTLYLNLYYALMDSTTVMDSTQQDLTCILSINGTTDVQMDYDSTTDSFTYNTAVSNIAYGNSTFAFTFYNTVSNLTNTQNDYKVLECNTAMVIKQPLDEFMYSRVECTDGTNYKIYDYPVITQAFYNDMTTFDDTINIATYSRKDAFIDAVLSRIAKFDVTNYRMTNTFVSIKFSNTCGELTNMNYNPVTIGYVDGIDPVLEPSVAPVPIFGNTIYPTYVVTNDNNSWTANYNKTTGGFLVTGSPDPSVKKWIFTNIDNNAIMYYDPTHTRNDTICTKMIYNGQNVVSLLDSIPLEIVMDVYMDPNYAMSEATMAENVQKLLVKFFTNKIGYDQNLYRTEIINTVQSITGVIYCSLKKPSHDIFFNYNIDDLKYNELLTYSPQLVYSTADHMTINVKKKR